VAQVGTKDYITFFIITTNNDLRYSFFKIICIKAEAEIPGNPAAPGYGIPRSST
jgi:hypothetical protein